MKHLFEATLTALTAIASSVLLVHGTVYAQDWSNKPVKLLVGSVPGGGTDAMARAAADRTGVGNPSAADAAAKSTDGHTMGMGVSTEHAIAPHLHKLGYDSNKDLVPVVFVDAVPNVLAVMASLPVDSVAALVPKALFAMPAEAVTSRNLKLPSLWRSRSPSREVM